MMTEEEKYGSSAPSAESPRSSSSKTPPSAPSAPSASSAPPAEEGGRDGDQRQKTPQHKPGSPSTSQQPVGALAISTTPESAAAAGSSHRKPTLLSRFYTAIQTALLSPSDLEEELESATEKLERRASSSGSSSPSLSIERRNSAPAGRSSLSASFLGGVSSGGGKGEEGGAEADVVGSSGGDLLVLLPNSLSDLEARYKNSNTHGTTTTPAIISTTSMSLDGHQIQPADTNDPPSHKMELLELLPNDVTEEDEAFFPNTLGDFFWELLGFSEESLAAAAAADGVSSSSGGDVNDTIIELTGTKSLSPQRQQHQQPSEDHHHQYDLLEEEPSRMSLFLERPPVKLISAATEGFSRSQIREEESDEEDGDDGGGIQRQKHLLDRLIMKQDICKQVIYSKKNKRI